MPTIPNLIQDSAQLQTGVGRQRVQSEPDAFGAQEARGLAQVGQGLRSVAATASDIDDDYNEADALELDNELSRRVRDRLYNPESGYLSTQRGRNAIDGRGQVEADLDAIAVELAGRARNQRSQALFRDIARRRVTGALGDVAEYATQQSRAYQNEQSESRIQEFIDNSVAAYSDPVAVAANMDGMVGELERIRRREGWGDDTFNSRRRQLQSDLTSRVIVSLAATDPEAAREMYARILPSLSAQEAGELRTTMRAAERQAEEDTIDEAWAYVSEGQNIPPDLWQRLPGRSRIDIQNERRRRAEGGAGTGDRALIEDLRVMAVADPERFATADLRAVRGALGSSYDDLAIAQAQIRQGEEPSDVVQQRTTFNAVRDVAANTLGMRLNAEDPENLSDAARAFNAALLREVEGHLTANPGVGIDGPTAQILIGRAYVGMRGSTVNRQQGGVQGERGRNRRSAVAPSTEVVVPYRAIPPDVARRIGTNLQRRLGRIPTQGEVENAYAALLRNQEPQIRTGGGQ